MLNDLHEEVQRIENSIHELLQSGADRPGARRSVRDSLLRLAGLEADSSMTLRESLESIASHQGRENKRSLGSVAIRLIGCNEILTSTEIDNVRPQIVQIIEQGCPDLATKIGKQKDLLSHQKIDLYREVHSDTCRKLSHLQHEFTNLQVLSARRPSVMAALNDHQLKDYLTPFGFDTVRASVAGLFKLASAVSAAEGRELQKHATALRDAIAEDLAQYEEVQTFVVRDHLLPFLRRLKDVVAELHRAMPAAFQCTISVSANPYEPEKKYPLHLVGSQVQILVPLTNEGPGVAEDVRAYYLTDFEEGEEVSIGDVAPGTVVLTLPVRIGETRERIRIDIEVSWGVVGEPARRRMDFAVEAVGQRIDLNWEALSAEHPYSLEVANAGEFYGRKDAVKRILARLAPGRMQSCYITGQKRVGKSSLAHAVRARIQDDDARSDYRVLYLECGEFVHASGIDTMRALGSSLEEFFIAELPRSVEWSAADYASSLTPLNGLLRQLQKVAPDTRFVVILDEFDEINEDLYRYGELASTFFLNLRTLSSRSNVAFVLVGAERMPHVMASQGEKLNKFDKESLNSFDLEAEWVDYSELVQRPVQDVITFHRRALTKLYEFTDGHPYFTKLLCAKIYELAVETKDAEVSNPEVVRAAGRAVSSLDANAFIHYWRDGIRGDKAEIEITSLNRCRVLAAWARAVRSGNVATREAINAKVATGRLGAGEVTALLDDFLRRGVFREGNGEYAPTVALFGAWLEEGGFTKFGSNQLGEELATAKQRREDEAVVSAGEIVGVVERWGYYQGRETTAEDVRAWLDQVDLSVDKRFLFRLLENIRFFGDSEVGDMFRSAHEWMRSKLPVPVKRSRAQRRDDVLVTYVDGPAKSGAYYGEIYARVNEINKRNVVERSALGGRLSSAGDAPRGVVVVDDFIGTGNTLTDNLETLVNELGKVGVGTEMPLSVVAICGTTTGERKVRRYMTDRMPNGDLEVCEKLGERHYAFGEGRGFWGSEREQEEAKALVTQLGAKVQRRDPIGFQGQGLLVVFSRNCPNNSLPILHAASKGGRQWRPLFPRSKA